MLFVFAHRHAKRIVEHGGWLAKDETDQRPFSLRLFFNHEGDSDSVIKGKAPSPFPAKIQ